MKCPFCGFLDSQVKDSRPSEDGLTIKRRRFCPDCGGRFTTYERIEMRELFVIKKGGDKRLFDPSKLLKSMQVAARKRPVDAEQLEEIVSRITKKLEKYGEGEITSQAVGQLVMNELLKIDQVAYVRYASVYKDFAEASDFGKFIENLNITKDE
ncbi:Transcriptional repressor NrdR [Candidatus Jidaibacter acanthamoeba]|uniref:Transcriptional repressor NrdR n=1 Tax=Candidatus Jidaibacter acanthamoebae TaxID=86105 RepID=A0A0C1MZY0_9RICK|nr:transcriptional regulator NrdR [Candidatus Jidaibacter acanthamoeba]KIE05631.1 Transcriptional repressor NrdR [Candidatus Jidaibacter acanthamoeba]